MRFRSGKAESSTNARASESDLAAALDAVSALVGARRVGSHLVERRLGISGAQLFVLRKLADALTGAA